VIKGIQSKIGLLQENIYLVKDIFAAQGRETAVFGKLLIRPRFGSYQQLRQITAIKSMRVFADNFEDGLLQRCKPGEW